MYFTRSIILIRYRLYIFLAATKFLDIVSYLDVMKITLRNLNLLVR